MFFTSSLVVTKQRRQIVGGQVFILTSYHDRQQEAKLQRSQCGRLVEGLLIQRSGNLSPPVFAPDPSEKVLKSSGRHYNITASQPEAASSRWPPCCSSYHVKSRQSATHEFTLTASPQSEGRSHPKLSLPAGSWSDAFAPEPAKFQSNYKYLQKTSTIRR